MTVPVIEAMSMGVVMRMFHVSMEVRMRVGGVHLYRILRRCPARCSLFANRFFTNPHC